MERSATKSTRSLLQAASAGFRKMVAFTSEACDSKQKTFRMISSESQTSSVFGRFSFE
jgi:hypothetical protein